MNKETQYVPSITVLMAVYNGERWLAESIQSVLDQTFTNFEFIIINDGSDDCSLEIINQFAKKDSRIRVYNKKNSGLTDSLNYGIAEARGEWIARIDADDICNLDRLQKQIEHVRINIDLVLVGSGLVIIDENGQQSKVHLYPARHIRLTRRLSRGSPSFAHSSAFFKLSAVEYSSKNSYLMLNLILKELKNLKGLIFYSLFMLPEDRKKRQKFFNQIFLKKSEIHFALEEIIINKKKDLNLIEKIFYIEKNKKNFKWFKNEKK